MECCLFEVEIKNRVVKKRRNKPIKGTQGKWYHERKLVIARDKSEAEELILKDFRARRIIGVSKRRHRSYLDREVIIEAVKKLV